MWGSSTFASELTKAVTFPQPFPNACDVVVFGCGDMSRFDKNEWVTAISTTGFTAHLAGVTVVNCTFWWIAIGR